MSVVGFSIGNENSVVVVARRRVIDTIQNEVGNRKTPTIVAFGDKQRFIGEDAVAQYASNASNTILNFKRLLGRCMNDPELPLEAEFADFKIVADGSELGYAAVEAKYAGASERFRPEQICAAMLQRLKAVAEKGLDGIRVQDCVIGVPPDWTQQQRRAMLEAASIAGLNVLRLLNETTAVALNYGILRPMADSAEPMKVCFVDVGQSATHVSVVKFSPGKLTVLGTGSARNLGGRNFDLMLVNHFAAYVASKYQLNVRGNTKAMFKLRKECNRIKTILSANSKVPFGIEFLMNDTDVKGEIDRTEFEAMAQPLLQTLLQTVDQALRTSQTNKNEVHSIEIVGGATRIPCVQKALEQFFGKEMSKTCDSDESVARGCCLQCAMLSPNYQVRPYELVEANTYPIDLFWGPPTPAGAEPLPFESQTQVFAPLGPVPNTKMVSFKNRDQPLRLVMKYTPCEQLPPGTNHVLGEYLIAAPSGTDSKVKVTASMNLNGIVAITKAQELRDVIELPTPASPAPAGADASPNASAPDAAQAEVPPVSPTPESSAAPEAAPQANDNAMEDDKPRPADDKPKPAEPAPLEPKKTTHRYNLKVDSFSALGITQAGINQFMERELQMHTADRAVADTLNARNCLESYLLETRNAFQGMWASYVLPVDSQNFCSQCDRTEEWLQEDGYDAQRSEYQQRLEELKKMGDPVGRRYNEASNRGSAVNLLRKTIDQVSAQLATTDEKYAHIDSQSRKKVADEAEAATSWLSSFLAQVEQQPKHEDPAIRCDEILARSKALEASCLQVMSKPAPPKPTPTPAPSAPADAPAAAPAPETSSNPAASEASSADAMKDDAPATPAATEATQG